MNFSEVMAGLSKASAFELYRLRTAIDQVLDDPKWIDAIRTRLQLGQDVAYFDLRTNGIRHGTVLELRRKHVVILESVEEIRWLLSYASINLDGADVQSRGLKIEGLGRHEIAIGDMLCFMDRKKQQHTGRVVRLNEQTVSLLCDNRRWLVPYQYLHRVLDVDAHDHRHAAIDVESTVLPRLED